MGNIIISVAGDNPLLKCEASGGSQAWSVEECFAFDHAAARTPEAFLNIVISLGMVGALSIVRYRTAIKDPMDLLYLFWSITTGITVGAGLYLLAAGAAVVVFGMLGFFYHRQQTGQIYIAVIHYQGDETGDKIIQSFGKMKYFIKSKTIRGEKTEMAAEVFCRNDDTVFVERIRELDGVDDITLIQYNGEYHG